MDDQDHQQVFLLFIETNFNSFFFLFSFFLFKFQLNELVIMAYLISQKQYDFYSSYKYLLNIRPTISPNQNYLQQLNQYSLKFKEKSIQNSFHSN